MNYTIVEEKNGSCRIVTSAGEFVATIAGPDWKHYASLANERKARNDLGRTYIALEVGDRNNVGTIMGENPAEVLAFARAEASARRQAARVSS